jgi:hypothetical protein
MTKKNPAVLGVTESVLRGLAVLNVLYGVGLLALLGASIAAPEFTLLALAGTQAKSSGALPAMRALIVVGSLAVPVTHAILARLRAMIATVRERDPFIVENASRLNGIAIGFLVLELLRLVVGSIVSRTALAALGMRVPAFSLTPWVAVLLLFVLARVFEQGARMREDLKGTI